MIIAGEHFSARNGNRGSGDRGTEIRYCPTSIDERRKGSHLPFLPISRRRELEYLDLI
jgi:hypothetical protein